MNGDENGTEGTTEQRGNIGNEIFEQVEKLIREEGLSRTNAFQRLSEMTGRRAGTVAANYYRVARQRGAPLQPRGRRASKARASVPAARASASGGGADAALSRAMESLQELAGIDRKSTRLNSSHIQKSRMPSSA